MLVPSSLFPFHNITADPDREPSQHDGRMNPHRESSAISSVLMKRYDMVNRPATADFLTRTVEFDQPNGLVARVSADGLEENEGPTD